MSSKVVIFDVNKYKNLNEIERDILNKINQKPMEFLDNNIIDISKTFYYSKSSISRLSQKMGFKHLKDMKLYINTKLSMLDLYSVNKDELDIKDRINNLKTYNIYAINETLSNIDANNVQSICKRIMKANKIFTYGLGSSFLAAQEMSENILKLGINSIAKHDLHNLLLALSSANKDDLLFLFSKSGENKEIIFLIKICDELNIDICLITCNETLSEKVKYKIIMKDL